MRYAKAAKAATKGRGEREERKLGGWQLNSSINRANNKGQQANATRISRCRHSEAAVQKPPDNVNKTMQTAARRSSISSSSNNYEKGYKTVRGAAQDALRRLAEIASFGDST